MKKIIILSFTSLIMFTVLTGIIYPLVITGVAKLFFPHQSEGSLIEANGKVVGSELIAQGFSGDHYFHPRPSAIDYNPMPSGATNFGPTSDTLKRLTELRRKEFTDSNNIPPGTYIPDDAIFASASGVDPDISPDNAILQINRIAKARNFDDAKKKKLEELINNLTENPTLGILGDKRINVLKLNILLDKI